LEALENVMSINESLSATVDSIVKAERMLFGLGSKLSFIELNVKFFKNERDKLGRFVADFSETERHLREMLRGEELRGFQTVLQIIDKFLKSPALIHLLG
jgi:hypothetical protein